MLLHALEASRETEGWAASRSASWCAQIGLRPEHIRQGEGLNAVVQRVEHLGDQNRLHLVLNGHIITTIADPASEYEPGTHLKITPNNPLCFDASGDRIR